LWRWSDWRALIIGRKARRREDARRRFMACGRGRAGHVDRDRCVRTKKNLNSALFVL
jgi:hypothetical protein